MAFLFCGGMMLGFGVVVAVRNGPGLPYLSLPGTGLLLIALTSWRLAVATVVIPRQTVVWFQYDQRTLAYRRFRDSDVQSCRTLNVLRVDAESDRRAEVVRYRVLLVGGRRLVLDRNTLENSDTLAEQLAADIAHSPRWMFS